MWTLAAAEHNSAMTLSRAPLSRALRLAGLAVAVLLAGCATRLEPPIVGYTCCNLHNEAGWISSSNLLDQPLIPAGERVRFNTIKKSYYVYGTIGSDDAWLRADSTRNKEETLRWARQLVVAQDPREQLASWEPVVQAAVRNGKVRPGMSRPQVLMALGPPSLEFTQDLGADLWRYSTAQDEGTVDLQFGADGTLVRVDGNAAQRRFVEFGL